MRLFDATVKTILEDNASGGGGVFGDGASFNHGGDFGNSDFWNTGNAQLPYVLGTFKRDAKKNTKRRRRKRNKRNRNKS
jgi:hypothetical protein